MWETIAQPITPTLCTVSQGESLTARLENIEVRYAGQMARLGRYAVHFHMIGTTRNSYCRSSSIHHTYSRAIALHGVHFLRVTDNVAFVIWNCRKR